MRLYNTMDRKVEELTPIHENKIGMYCCGPTVYSDAHIGNLRSYIFEDILHKTIEKAGYEIKHVMNITDVGHLTSDGDEGEDKMEKAAKEQQKSVLDIARTYEDRFFADCAKLRIKRPDVICRATDYVQEMIDMAKTLEEKGFAYFAGGNLYFDTAKYPKYGQLSGQKLEDRMHGARVEVDKNKKNDTDFVLWFTSSKYENHALQWDSPWGRGYPGWHIECSAMATKHLGDRVDIHCGGVDNIHPHHENEIAQSECCSGHKWVNFWVHGEHLNLKDGKMSKSKGHKFTISSLEEKGFKAEHYRYLCLTAHYRTQLIFSYENLENAKNTYNNLVKKIRELKSEISTNNSPLEGESKSDSDWVGGVKDDNSNKSLDSSTATSTSSVSAQNDINKYMTEFNEYLFDDLNTPRALATMWTALKDDSLTAKDKLDLIYNAEDVFSLGLKEVEAEESLEIPAEIESLLEQRKEARANKDWAKSDEIRDAIAELGYVVKDTKNGQEIEAK